MDEIENEKIKRGDFKRKKEKVPNEDNGEVKPKKLKKRHIVGIVFLCIITILIVAPIATVYGLFYDGKSYKFEHDTHFNINKDMEDIPFNALDSARSDGELRFSITEKTLNNLLYEKATENVKKATNGIVNNFVIDIDEKNKAYHFYIEAAIPLFKSRLVIDAELQGDEPGDKAFVFKISNISIGRLEHIDKFVMQIVEKYAGDYLDDATINDMFSGLGLSLKINIKEKSMTYVKEDIIKDMKELIGNHENIMDNLIEGFISNGAFEYNLCTKDSISAVVNLKETADNAKYCTKDDYPAIVSGDALEKDSQILEKLINECHVIDIQDMKTDKPKDHSNELNALFNFIVRGWDDTSASNRTKIKGFLDGLTSEQINNCLGVTDYRNYEGAVLPEPVEGENEDEISVQIKEDLENNVMIQVNKFLDSMPSGSPTIDNKGDLCVIKEKAINDAIKRSGIIGGKNQLFSTYQYRSNDSDDIDIKINFITVNNFYLNVLEDSVYFVMGLSVNGFDSSICIDSSIVINGDQIVFTIKNIYIGSILTGGDLSNWIFDNMLGAGVEIPNMGWLQSGKNENGEKTISFNFGEVIENAINGVKSDVDSTYPAFADVIKTQIDTLREKTYISAVGDGLKDEDAAFVLAYDLNK